MRDRIEKDNETSMRPPQKTGEDLVAHEEIEARIGLQ